MASKKTNTVLFIVVASVFNVIAAVVVFAALFAVFFLFILPHVDEKAAVWALPVIFVLAIAASFVIYRAALRLFIKRFNVTDTLAPLFSPKKK
jgi:hypothetical protein